MNTPPISTNQSGPGIELTEESAGIAIQISDPNPDLAYARNGVTLTYALSGAVTA